MASPKGDKLTRYESLKEVQYDQLRYSKTIISHQWNTILSVGCIYTFGLWILFLLTLLFIQKVF